MKNIIKILIAAFLLSFGISTWAQAPPPPPGNAQTGGGGSPGPIGGNNPAGAPIDGGPGILMAIGLAYGIKKLYQVRKIKTIQSEVKIN